MDTEEFSGGLPSVRNCRRQRRCAELQREIDRLKAEQHEIDPENYPPKYLPEEKEDRFEKVLQWIAFILFWGWVITHWN